MKVPAALVLLLSVAPLTGCFPTEIPKTPAEAVQQLEQTKSQLISFGERAVEIHDQAVETKEKVTTTATNVADAAGATLTTVGEVALNGAEASKEPLETLGDTVIATTDAVTGGLEALGNSVLSLTAPPPQPEPQDGTQPQTQ